MSKKKDEEYETVDNEIDIEKLKKEKNKYKENYFKKIQKQIEEEDEEYENSSKRKTSYRRSRDRDEETEEKVVKIKEFDMNSLPPRNVSDKSGVKIVVIGKAGTGKSTIISDIIASKSHIIPVAQVFSGTEDGNHYYSEKFPKVCVYNKLDIDALHSFKKRQLIAKKYLSNPWAIQILDDCTEDRRVFNQPIIQDYYKNGRHWSMLHILSLQYAMDIPPAIRTNVDYAFILREPNLKNRKNLYENYAGSCINSFDEFEQIMDTITEDYTALVIKNMNSSNKLEDNIFWYKAKLGNIPPNWKFGHPTCWDFNNERYDPKTENIF
jgi:GTPase SAR1 family protein